MFLKTCTGVLYLTKMALIRVCNLEDICHLIILVYLCINSYGILWFFLDCERYIY